MPSIILRACSVANLPSHPESLFPVRQGFLWSASKPSFFLPTRWTSRYHHLTESGLLCADSPLAALEGSSSCPALLSPLLAVAAVDDGVRRQSALMHGLCLTCEDGSSQTVYCTSLGERDGWLRALTHFLQLPVSIGDLYDIAWRDVLGAGRFATVLPARDCKTSERVAIKVLRSAAYREHRGMVAREIAVWHALGQHPHVVGLREVLCSTRRAYFVADLCEGGDLLAHLAARPTYCERDVSAIARQLLEAVQHMHSKRILHMDIKPENIVVAAAEVSQLDDAPPTIKVIDFSLAAFFDSPCDPGGTPEFVAPELVSRPDHFAAAGCGPEVDMWAVGVVLFYLLVGQSPFWAPTQERILEKVRSGAWAFRGKRWEGVSQAARDLVARLLKVDPEARLSASAALQHRWVRDGAHNPTTVLTEPLAAFQDLVFATSAQLKAEWAGQWESANSSRTSTGATGPLSPYSDPRAPTSMRAARASAAAGSCGPEHSRGAMPAGSRLTSGRSVSASELLAVLQAPPSLLKRMPTSPLLVVRSPSNDPDTGRRASSSYPDVSPLPSPRGAPPASRSAGGPGGTSGRRLSASAEQQPPSVGSTRGSASNAAEPPAGRAAAAAAVAATATAWALKAGSSAGHSPRELSHLSTQEGAVRGQLPPTLPSRRKSSSMTPWCASEAPPGDVVPNTVRPTVPQLGRSCSSASALAVREVAAAIMAGHTPDLQQLEAVGLSASTARRLSSSINLPPLGHGSQADALQSLAFFDLVLISDEHPQALRPPVSPLSSVPDRPRAGRVLRQSSALGTAAGGAGGCGAGGDRAADAAGGLPSGGSRLRSRSSVMSNVPDCLAPAIAAAGGTGGLSSGGRKAALGEPCTGGRPAGWPGASGAGGTEAFSALTMRQIAEAIVAGNLPDQAQLQAAGLDARSVRRLSSSLCSPHTSGAEADGHHTTGPQAAPVTATPLLVPPIRGWDLLTGGDGSKAEYPVALAAMPARHASPRAFPAPAKPECGAPRLASDCSNGCSASTTAASPSALADGVSEAPHLCQMSLALEAAGAGGAVSSAVAALLREQQVLQQRVLQRRAL